MTDYSYKFHKPEDIASFKAAADDLIGSKYILAEKRISELLKTIAENPGLISLFKTALSGYNYSVEFNKWQIKAKSALFFPKIRQERSRTYFVF